MSLALITVGCGTQHGLSTGSIGDSAEQRRGVLSDYEQYWSGVLAASNPVSLSHPSLLRYATGSELERIRKMLTVRAAARETVRGRYAHASSVDLLSESSAMVHDCLTVDIAVIDSRTGRAKAASPPGPFALDVSMVRSDQGWQVLEVKAAARSCEGPNVTALEGANVTGGTQ